MLINIPTLPVLPTDIQELIELQMHDNYEKITVSMYSYSTPPFLFMLE